MSRSGDTAADFEAYEARARALFGDAAPGAYAKFAGRLVRRLDAAAFDAVHRAYLEARAAFDARLVRGDTLDDASMQELAEKAAMLLLPVPELGPAGG